MLSHQRNGNENQNETPFHANQDCYSNNDDGDPGGGGDGDDGALELSYTARGSGKRYDLCGQQFSFPQKLKISIRSSNSIPTYITKRIRTGTLMHACTRMSVAALIVITKSGHNPDIHQWVDE